MIPSKTDYYVIQEEEKYKQLFKLKEVELTGLSFKYPNNIIVNILGEGSNFGEIGVYYKTLRTATVVSRQNHLHLGYIQSRDFDSTLRCIFDSDVYKQKIRFLKGMSQFASIEPQFLNILLLISEEFEFSNGYVFYHNGDNPDFVYILLEGEAELEKSYLLQAKDEVDIITPSSHTSPQNPGDTIQSYIQKINEALSPEIKKYLVLNNKRKKFMKKIPISIVSAGNVFGDEHIPAGGKRTETARCISCTGKALKLSRRSYFDQLKIHDNMLELSKIKEDFHTQFGQDLQSTQIKV